MISDSEIDQIAQEEWERIRDPENNPPWDGLTEEQRQEDRAHVRRVVARVFDAAAARGGTMTAEQLARTLNSLWHEPEEDRRCDLHFSAWHHYAAQGATVATLQAKVEELKASADELQRQRDLRGEAIEALERAKELADHLYNEEHKANLALRAEVERLKAENAECRRGIEEMRGHVAEGQRGKELTDHLYNEEHLKRLAAESRLAAIRDRGTDQDRLALVWHADHELPLAQRLASLARWVLEGDALTMPSVQQHEDLQRLTGAEPREMNDERGCFPSCPSYLNSGHTHPELPENDKTQIQHPRPAPADPDDPDDLRPYYERYPHAFQSDSYACMWRHAPGVGFCGYPRSDHPQRRPSAEDEGIL